MGEIREHIISLYPQLEYVCTNLCDTDVKWELVFKVNNLPRTECVVSCWSAGYRIDYRKQHYDSTYGKVYDVRNMSGGFLPSTSFIYITLSKLL